MSGSITIGTEISKVASQVLADCERAFPPGRLSVHNQSDKKYKEILGEIERAAGTIIEYLVSKREKYNIDRELHRSSPTSLQLVFCTSLLRLCDLSNKRVGRPNGKR